MTITPADRIDLNALADGELDAGRATTFKTRLETDAELRAAYEEISATRAAMTNLSKPEVSADLAQRIARLAASGRPPRAAGFASWRSLAASLLVAAIAASSATYLLVPHGPSFEDLAAAGHRRSLLAESPVDVASSDRHTVKPWLDARLGVSPPAPDLAGLGYPLMGGRVDVLGSAVAPTLVYRHNEHTISVVAIPGPATLSAERSIAAGGYNMIEWTENGFSFTAVSDLEASELAAFVDDYRKSGA